MATTHDPKKSDTNTVHRILDYDLAGLKQGEIAEKMGMSQMWVCKIQTAPFYKMMKSEKFNQVHDKVMNRVTDEVIDTKKVLDAAKGKAAKVLVDILDNGRSEAVKAKVASDIIGLNKENKEQTIIVQINEKLGERMQKVLDYPE
jgi:DNA-directed RNA polymerase specialized sigma subunit